MGERDLWNLDLSRVLRKTPRLGSSPQVSHQAKLGYLGVCYGCEQNGWFGRGVKCLSFSIPQAVLPRVLSKVSFSVWAFSVISWSTPCIDAAVLCPVLESIISSYVLWLCWCVWQHCTSPLFFFLILYNLHQLKLK